MTLSPLIHQHTNSDSSMSSGGYSNGTVPSLTHAYPSVDSRFSAPNSPPAYSVASVNTYRTTVDSSLDDDDDPEQDYYYYYPEPPKRTLAVPSTPQQFADLFPGTRKLHIAHDDGFDGSMNLRVDCNLPQSHSRHHGRQPERVTLFHVRMYDLRDRDFSVRRYGRDCGREVAHVKRKTVAARPSLRRALTSFRGEKGGDFAPPSRQDSGYISGGEHGDDDDDDNDDDDSTPGPSGQKATNTHTLEFSNYAHVDLNRKGHGSGKKYDFEYWGAGYSWKRRVELEGCIGERVSYELVNNVTRQRVAGIRPTELTHAEAIEEEARGGFVPPCTMWLEEAGTALAADVADVVVSTGLIALIDDSIKRKYHRKRTVQLSLPSPGKSPLKMKMEYVGPRRFIDEIITRRPGVTRTQSAAVSRAQTPVSSPIRRGVWTP